MSSFSNFFRELHKDHSGIIRGGGIKITYNALSPKPIQWLPLVPNSSFGNPIDTDITENNVLDIGGILQSISHIPSGKNEMMHMIIRFDLEGKIYQTDLSYSMNFYKLEEYKHLLKRAFHRIAPIPLSKVTIKRMGKSERFEGNVFFEQIRVINLQDPADKEQAIRNSMFLTNDWSIDKLKNHYYCEGSFDQDGYFCNIAEYMQKMAFNTI